VPKASSDRASEALAILLQWAGDQPTEGDVAGTPDEQKISPFSISQKQRLWNLSSSPEAPGTITFQLPR
jgi:hypothetical protein